MHANTEFNPKPLPVRWAWSAVASGLVLAMLALAPTSVHAQAASGDDDEPEIIEGDYPWPDDLSKPPDGNWLVDEEGLEYFTFELPKEMLRYSRVSPNMIRLARGPHLRLAGESETSLTIKIVNNKSVPMPERAPTPSAEDLAAVAADYTVAIAEVDRYGFEAVGKGLPTHGLWRNGFDVADMNGDGHLDIIHGPARKSGTVPVIFLGDGAGNWRLWDTIFPEAPYDYGDVVAADLNGDGKLDLGLAFHIRGMLALLGDGKGGFKKWSNGIGLEIPGDDEDLARPPFSARAIEAVDWDGDGRTDLVALSEGPRGFEHVNARTSNGLIFYRNIGDGNWVRQIDRTSVIFGDKVSLGDVDGDGRPEVISSTNYAGERGLINRWLGSERPFERVAIDELRPSALIWSSTTGDFNGDGRDDIVVGYRNREMGVRRTGLDVLLAGEDGAWHRTPLLVRDEELTHLDIHAIATGDVDGDGDRDLAATTRQGQLFMFLGDGKGGFEREVEETMEKPLLGCRGYDLEIVDLDDKAGGEIIATFSGENCPKGGSIRAWRVVPKATVAPAADAPVAPAADAPVAPAADAPAAP